MPPLSDPMVLTLRSPHDLLEAVPYLLGFEPHDSLVALGLRGRRQRLGVTVRVDLGDPADTDAVADRVVDALRADRATAAVLVGYGSPDGVDPDGVVGAIRQRLAAHDIPVAEALRVVAGCWTSYTCSDADCCPPGGTPVRDRLRSPGAVGSAAVLAGRQVLSDRDALAATLAPVRGAAHDAMALAIDRELERFLGLDGGLQRGLDGDIGAGAGGGVERRSAVDVGAGLSGHVDGDIGTVPGGLVDGDIGTVPGLLVDGDIGTNPGGVVDGDIGGYPGGPVDRAARRRLGAAGSRRPSPDATPQLDAYTDATLKLVRAVLRRASTGGEVLAPVVLTVDEAARLIVGMLDVTARDACLDGFPEVTDDLLFHRPALALDPDLRPGAGRLWAALVPRAVRPGTAAPVSTLLAWNAYIHHGGGAQLTIALERAVDDVPGYVMAQGLLALLGGAVTPTQFRAMVSGSPLGRASRRHGRCA